MQASKCKLARSRTLVEDNEPPSTWSMDRITNLWLGADGHVRVVSVQINNTVVKRTVTKICVLHTNEASTTVTVTGTQTFLFLVFSF